MNLTDKQWAYLTLRLTLGINMLMHGLTRVVGGLGNFAENTSGEFTDGILPMALVHPFLYVLPIVELVIGVMMALGVGLRYGLIAGALTITALTFGSTAIQNWSAAGIQLSYALAFFVLLFTREYDRLSIDSMRGAGPSETH